MGGRFLSRIFSLPAAIALSLPALVARAEPVLVSDINRTVSVGPQATRATVVGSRWILPLCAKSDCRIWGTDANSEGTRDLGDLLVDCDRCDYGAAQLGGYAYFVAGRLGENSSVWKSDGTPAGTTKVFDGAIKSSIASFNGAIYFFSIDGLWKYDGAAATRVTNVSSADELTIAAGRLFFTQFQQATGSELWTSDGTSAGTVIVKDLFPGQASAAPTGLTAAGAKLFFWARSDDSSPTLWSSDGTDSGTVQVLNIPGMALNRVVAAAGKAFLLGQDASGASALIASDGTPAGTSVLRTWFGPSNPDALVSAGDLVFFPADGDEGRELWKSDGTVAGTRLAADLLPGATSSGPNHLVVSNGYVFLSATSASGFPAVTKVSIATGESILVNAPQTLPESLPWVALGDKVLLATFAFGDALLITDGTPLGTTPFTTAVGEPNSTSYCTEGHVRVGTFVYFPANDGIHGCELWRSDGTPAGTSLVIDSTPGSRDGILPSTFRIATDGTLVFFITGDHQLWTSDGTPTGTVNLPDSSGFVNSVRDLVGIGDRVAFFQSETSALYVSNGSGRPSMVDTLAASWTLARFGGDLLYVVPSAGSGILSKASLSTLAVTRVATLPRLTTSAIAVAGSQAYFTLPNATDGQDLWATDGTAPGTSRVADISPGSRSLDNLLLGSVGNVVIFTGLSGGPSRIASLWRSDGTSAGTYPLSSVAPYASPAGELASATLSGHLYVAAHDGTRGDVLVSTDGTVSGTRKVTQGIIPGPLDAVMSNGTLYMAGQVDPTPARLVMSNGVTAGLVPVQNGKTLPRLTKIATTADTVAGGLLMFSGLRYSTIEPSLVALDSQPDPFVFPSQDDVRSAAAIVSSAAAIVGLNSPATFTVNGGEACVSSSTDCGCDIAAFSASGQVTFAEYLCARHTSAAGTNATTTSTVTVGGGAATFTSTTAPAQHLEVVHAGPGTGKVSSAGHGIDCGTACTADVPKGTLVTLLAEPAKGSLFSGWSLAACGRAMQCAVTMDAATTATATFALDTRRGLATDLDGDGMEDLLWVHPSGAQGAWLMNGDMFSSRGTFAPPATGATMTMTGDFDGDGRTDILWKLADGTHYITLMDGLAIKASAKVLDCCSGWSFIGKGDLDGDGKTDLLLRHDLGLYGVWLMDGATVAQASLLSPPGAGGRAILFADFDGDGRTDILWQRGDGAIDISLMSGVAATSSSAVLGGNTGWFPTTTGDLDGDGKADVVLAHVDGSQGAWLMDGAVVRQATLLLGRGTGWHIRKTADLDGDGKSDLIWAHEDGSWGAWLMDGLARRTAGSWLPAGTGWSLHDVHDFDGDGKQDLLWRHSSGQYGLWLMDGLSIRRATSLMQAGTGWELLR